MKKALAVAVVLAILAAGGCSNMPYSVSEEDLSLQWNYQKSVQFSESTDICMLYVKDGDETIKMHMQYDDPSIEEVDSWKPGRKLTIEYTPEHGLWLVDDESKAKLRILEFQDHAHPIDILLDQYLSSKEGMGNLFRADCYIEAKRQWEKEMGRAFIALLPEFPKNKRGNLIEAQRRGLAFRDFEEAMIGDLFDHEGHVWPVCCCHIRMDLTRERALQLMSYTHWPMDWE